MELIVRMLSLIDKIGESPYLLLLILLAATHFIRQTFFKNRPPIPASGNIIMAIGLLTLYGLPSYHVNNFVERVFALELFVLCGYFFMTYLHGYINDIWILQRLPDRIAMGTWVSAAAIVALVIDYYLPLLHGFIIFLGLFSVIMWLFYLGYLAKEVIFPTVHRQYEKTMSIYFLSVISTQAVVLLIDGVFGGDVPAHAYQLIILFGLFMYMIIFMFGMKHLLQEMINRESVVWHNNNCFYYGAIAITGLTMINTQVMPADLIVMSWWWSLMCLLIVESVEIIRGVIRIYSKGVCDGIFVYDTTQWARNFSIGVFYAFTYQVYSNAYEQNSITSFVKIYGHHMIVILLVIELLLAVIDRR